MANWGTELIKKFKKVKKRNFYKAMALILILIVLDRFGIFIHLFEDQYTKYFQYPMYGLIYEYTFNLRYGRGDFLTEPLNYNEFGYSITPKCTLKDVPAPSLTLLISSDSANGDKRMAIRATWGDEQPFPNIRVRRLFLLGQNSDPDLMASVLNESKVYGDILQSDSVESQFNNTLMAMHSLIKICRTSPYYMFVKDNYYVSIKNVLRYINNPNEYPDNPHLPTNADLHQKGPYHHLFAGYIVQTRPIRNKFSKRFVNLEDYPYNKYPPYMQNAAFIITHNTLIDLYHATYFTKHLKMIDAYLGIVAFKGLVHLDHCEYFYDYAPTYKSPKGYGPLIAAKGFDDPLHLMFVWNKTRAAKNSKRRLKPQRLEVQKL